MVKPCQMSSLELKNDLASNLAFTSAFRANHPPTGPYYSIRKESATIQCISPMLSAELLVNLWIAGFLIAAVLQTLTQKHLSSETSWGFAPGWQREIGVWNIGITGLIISLRISLPSPDSAIVPGLSLLSLLLGTNHLISAAKDPKKTGHWAGVAGNFLGVTLYLLFVITRR